MGQWDDNDWRRWKGMVNADRPYVAAPPRNPWPERVAIAICGVCWLAWIGTAVAWLIIGIEPVAVGFFAVIMVVIFANIHADYWDLPLAAQAIVALSIDGGMAAAVWTHLAHSTH